jgi:peptidoglycan/xylan/chitin deacetylase (PgdA/CDA1 family)
VAGVLCVGGSRSGRAQLVYQSVSAHGRGPGHVIPAAITRSASKDLTARFVPADIGTSYTSLRWQVLSTLRVPGCVPPSTSRLGCVRLFPAKPALASLHTPRPLGCVPSGASYVTNGSRSRRVIALTFDDGPWPDTPEFLNILEREHVHATFFQIGRQVGTYGKNVDHRILADGDMLGDHTWDHANVAGDGPFAAGEIASTRSAIAQLTGFTPCLFRAPGGGVSSALISEARRMGFVTIGWDVDTRDWARPGTRAIYSTAVGTAREGSIILQHDGGGDRSETVAALPAEIRTFKARGYRFLTIPELLGLRVIYK